MPTYNQIADYINNRRKALGDNNDIDALKEFVNKNLIYYETHSFAIIRHISDSGEIWRKFFYFLIKCGATI